MVGGLWTELSSDNRIIMVVVVVVVVVVAVETICLPAEASSWQIYRKSKNSLTQFSSSKTLDIYGVT